MTTRPLLTDRARRFAVIVAILLSACFTSRPAARVAADDDQRGTSGTVLMTNGSQHYGELLAIEDSAIVLMVGQRVATGGFPDISRVAFGTFVSSDLRGATQESLKKGRALSRFPYGVPPVAMAALLEGARQVQPVSLMTLKP